MNKKLLFFLTAVLFSMASAFAQTYHPDDKEGLRAFLRQPSAIEGQINAEQLGLTISDTLNWQTDEAWVNQMEGTGWSWDSPNRLVLIADNWSGKNLSGTLDATKWTELTYLSCGFNQLTSLDVSNNTELTLLRCDHNQLTSLDVSNNTKLIELSCGVNQLTSLDVSSNTALTYLECQYLGLTNLDVSSNLMLTYLSCGYNYQLTSLNISSNTALSYLDCSCNPFTSLDVSNNIELTLLRCHYNQLTSLDVSNNTALTELCCGLNHLTSLDISNCTALTFLDCGANPLTNLNVSSNTALTYLDCQFTQLTSLDVGSSTALTNLRCPYGRLTSLDVSNNTALTDLWCGGNQLTSLNVINNTALTGLECTHNQLPLSDLYVASIILENNEADMSNRVLGYQNMPAQSVALDTALFSNQSVFNGIYTNYTVMQNDSPAPESDYTVVDGKITFHKLGVYIVTMTNEAIISSEDSPAEVSVELTVTDVGVNEHGLSNITVYPNPTTGELTIETSDMRYETSDMRYEIFDIYGRKLISDIRYPISEIGKSEIEINISHLPAGIYFVKIGNETVKVVKQ